MGSASRPESETCKRNSEEETMTQGKGPAVSTEKGVAGRHTALQPLFHV